MTHSTIHTVQHKGFSLSKGKKYGNYEGLQGSKNYFYYRTPCKTVSTSSPPYVHYFTTLLLGNIREADVGAQRVPVPV